MPDTKDNGATSSLPSELERLAKLFQSSAISKVDFAQFKSKLISSAVAMPPSAILDGLEQLARLHQSGLLTQQEFELAKTRISSASGDNARDVKNEHVKSRNRNRQSYNQTALVLDATKIPSSGWSFITNLGRFLWGRLLGEPVEARLQHPALQNEQFLRAATFGVLGIIAIGSVWALWSSFGTDAETPEVTASGDTQVMAEATSDIMASRYGNTTVSTDAKGMQTRFYYNADRTFRIVSNDGIFSGTWAVEGNTICFTYNAAPVGTPNPLCVPVTAHKVGDTWTTAKGNKQVTTTLVRGLLDDSAAPSPTASSSRLENSKVDASDSRDFDASAVSAWISELRKTGRLTNTTGNLSSIGAISDAQRYGMDYANYYRMQNQNTLFGYTVLAIRLEEDGVNNAGCCRAPQIEFFVKGTGDERALIGFSQRNACEIFAVTYERGYLQEAFAEFNASLDELNGKLTALSCSIYPSVNSVKEGAAVLSSVSGCNSIPVKAEITRTVIDGLRRAPSREADDRWWNLTDIKTTRTMPNGFACSASIQMGNNRGVLKSLPITFITKYLNAELTVDSFEIKSAPTEPRPSPERYETDPSIAPTDTVPTAPPAQ